MVLTERAVLQFIILILCAINGLHSYPRNHPSLGILNELIGTDSKSPLIVVVDSNNQVKTLDDASDRGYGQGQGHSKSYPHHPDHVHISSHNHDNSSPKMSNQDYEAALYKLLRTSQKMLENQARQGSYNRKTQNDNKDRCGDDGKKDSCEPDKQEFLAEQCSQSEDSCGNFDDKETC